MQAMFHAGSNLRFSGEILQYLTHDLIGLRVHEEPNVEPAPKLQEEFELKDASFFYPNSSTKVLRDINLTIPRNRTVALVGATGSGKSTCLDILMGLHIPTSGCLQVDGNTLTPGSTLGWRTKCGYVPQTIFLTDESIEKNIAFGIPENEIEIAAVRRAARIANIDSFIESLPQSYQTEVGERGIRLSGGQRQRIGIARALYHDPDVLFFDEATSALDNATERSVMNAITELSGQKTMVIVAHRLDTIRLADKICVLDNGRLVGEGPWEELSHNCPTFQNLLNSMEKEEK
jgi:ABC-type multidrug transport system fused ATPase/permease subunit